MFEYKKCKGKRFENGWLITYEDGSKDFSSSLSFALMLCDKKLKRASI